MKRILIAPALIGSALTLAGCLPMMALSAAQMAVSSTRKSPVSNAELKSTAEAACSARAAGYGAVHVIDVQQAKVNKIIVWGTVGDGVSKQSFQCDFGTAITAFTLRPITPVQ